MSARQRAEAAVAGISSSLQGATGVDLAMRSYLTNEQGRTVVHAYQRYQGHRVWGSSAVIRTDAQGIARLQASNFASTPTPAGSPVLTAQQAINIALKAHGAQGAPGSAASGARGLPDQVPRRLPARLGPGQARLHFRPRAQRDDHAPERSVCVGLRGAPVRPERR